MIRPIKQHLRKHRKAYASYARWEWRSHWFMVDCSKPYIRFSNTWNDLWN